MDDDEHLEFLKENEESNRKVMVRTLWITSRIAR